eukprot:CAMPEP_0113582782 /NCGR_PEP_ID=MMETSP0015_2-20120614/32121_1 /TAXON_ID=2838 /ORGANISM="Odontella" /LENGTH=997 /DNA_ID=CAMNT_0000487523 /DNA_START=309 /DNA_END=3302 /DNA_ORIENTATION=- /assembly_acc=CAM_ASM_000160
MEINEKDGAKPTRLDISTSAKLHVLRRRCISHLGVWFLTLVALTLFDHRSWAFVVQSTSNLLVASRAVRNRERLVVGFPSEGFRCERFSSCRYQPFSRICLHERAEGQMSGDAHALESVDGQGGIRGEDMSGTRRDTTKESNESGEEIKSVMDQEDRSTRQVSKDVKRRRTNGEYEHKAVCKETKKEIHTYSARYIDDNGLAIVTDGTGRVTARLVGDVTETDSVNVYAEGKGKSAKRSESTTSKAEPTLVPATVADMNDSVVEAEPKVPKTKTVIPELIRTWNPSDNFDSAPVMSSASKKEKKQLQEHPAPKIVPTQGFNVVLTHCTADFDSLASAVGLAKLWSSNYDPTQIGEPSESKSKSDEARTASAYQSSRKLPTFVVLPRGAHPDVQRFLALHKHLFPIKSLRSLPTDLSGLNRLGLVDAQRRDRVGPAEHLLGFADRVTIVDHHIDAESDIPEATDFVVDKVGSVSTMIVERLRDSGTEITEAEATLLALGIHADTGSLCFDSSTPRDAQALAWVMAQGASQTAIAEHAKGSLSPEQQGVLTQALVNTNSTDIHGVTVSTVLLSADGFINGLAAVTQDALELSSSDVFLLCVVYDAKSGGRRKNKRKGEKVESRLLETRPEVEPPQFMSFTEAWKGGEEAMKKRRLRAAFDKKDTNGSGYLERSEIAAALLSSGTVATPEAIDKFMAVIDTNNDGRVDFAEFCVFATTLEEQDKKTGRQASTMIIIGRVKAGVNTKAVNLNRLFQQFGGGGHAKAASATVRLGDESEAGDILNDLVDELIETGLAKQSTVGDFMTAPVLSAKPTMNEMQVEDLFSRYDVRALPVVDDDNNVIGLVTYKEVAAAKQRLWNKEQKRLRQEAKAAAEASSTVHSNRTSDKSRAQKRHGEKVTRDRKLGSALKGWMKQHVRIIEASTTMAEAEMMLLENDVGCIPVVADGSKQLVGMVTRTDLLRQHQYYRTLHYHNKGFSDSIAARKPIIELRKRLKQFDLDE